MKGTGLMKQSTRNAIMAELKAAQAIADLAESEDRDLTDDERGQVSARVEKAKELRARSEEAGAVLKSLGDLGSGVDILPHGDERDEPSQYHHVARKSVGQAFVDSVEYKSLLASAPGGRFADQGRVQSQPFGVKSLITGADDASAGAFISPTQATVPGDFFNQRPMTIRQLFSPGQTTSDSVEYVQLLSQTNNAAAVPEAKSTATVGDGTGGTATVADAGVKPQSGFTTKKQTAPVKTVAHWIPATKRSLSDAAQVRTLIDTFLRYGLEEAFEDQLMSGDGQGENFVGLDYTSGVQTQVAPGANEDVFTVTRRGRRLVRTVGHSIPTAFVLNPIDWENIELMRDSNERFYGAGPFSMTPNTLWSLPVVESEAVEEGTGWVADWRMGIVWDREQASIQATDAHADFFIRNLVAILAEMRAAFGVLRPAAFVKIALA